MALFGYHAVRPRDAARERNIAGKPRLARQNGPRFNITHSGSSGLVAVNAYREVGTRLCWSPENSRPRLDNTSPTLAGAVDTLGGCGPHSAVELARLSVNGEREQ